MKTININVEIDITKWSDAEKKMHNDMGTKFIFENLLMSGLSSLNPQGVQMRDGKILNRITQKLDKMSARDELLELEESEYELLKKVFLNDETKFNVLQLNLACKFAERVENHNKYLNEVI